MPFLTDRLDDHRRKELERVRLREVNAAEAPGPLAEAGVAEGPVSEGNGTGRGLEGRYAFDVETVMNEVRREILGQEAAVAALERVLHIVRADISDPRRPLHTALLLGPTGVGKTEMVRALARGLHGDADAFCRIDMNTLSQEHYAAALTGAPPGYVGSKEGTTLLNQELVEGSLRKPGIVLFDEIEKASDAVVLALLNVFDNGILTVASGERTYSFRNTLIFMTSNLGARQLQAYQQRVERFPAWLFYRSPGRQSARVRQLVEKELLARFAPEFINRIDTLSVFNWLQGDVLRDLVQLELRRLNRRLRKHGIDLTLDAALERWLAKAGFDRRFGARALRRVLRHQVEAPLAHYLLTAYRGKASTTTTRIEGFLQQGAVRFRDGTADG